MPTYYATPSSQLIGGQPPQSYGAFPSNSGIQPSRGSSRYASPGPTAAFPELLPPLSPQLFSRPPVPPIGPTLVPTPTRSPKKGSKGLVIWLTIVFLQVALIAYRSDTLAKWINLENKASSLSSRRTSLVAERQKSEQEREKLRHERELWDREVPEDRVPQGAYWKPIWPANYCLEYGKRGYWGMLMDVPDGWSAMDACMNMPAQIKGVTIRRPHSCIFADGYPHILGYWMVDWGQEDCKPWYKDIRDTGCTNYRSGLTRLEANVEGIIHRKEQDWRLMCESTPFTWDGVNYTSPAHCEERGFGGGTKVAMWVVPAERCRYKFDL